MLSGFITKDGFLVLTEEDVHNINAQRAMKGTYLDSNANNETERKKSVFSMKNSFQGCRLLAAFKKLEIKKWMGSWVQKVYTIVTSCLSMGKIAKGIGMQIKCLFKQWKSFQHLNTNFLGKHLYFCSIGQVGMTRNQRMQRCLAK